MLYTEFNVYNGDMNNTNTNERKKMENCPIPADMLKRAISAMQSGMMQYVDDEWPDREWQVATEVCDDLDLTPDCREYLADNWSNHLNVLR